MCAAFSTMIIHSGIKVDTRSERVNIHEDVHVDLETWSSYVYTFNTYTLFTGLSDGKLVQQGISHGLSLAVVVRGFLQVLLRRLFIVQVVSNTFCQFSAYQALLIRLQILILRVVQLSIVKSINGQVYYKKNNASGRRRPRLRNSYSFQMATATGCVMKMVRSIA